MAEYIKREDAIHAICFFCRAEEGENCDKRDECHVLPRLLNVPSADVVERKCGKWLRTPTAWVYCSVCGKEPPDETNATTPFCPWCGADMRGEEVDDDGR